MDKASFSSASPSQFVRSLVKYLLGALGIEERIGNELGPQGNRKVVSLVVKNETGPDPAYPFLGAFGYIAELL